MWQWIFLLVLGTVLLISEADARLRKRIEPKPYSPKYSSIVMDADTGQILHTEDATGIRHPASLTKMMTLYMAFEALKSGKVTLKTRMPVSSRAARQAPSKLGLNPGETISLQTAILGLVTKSANDAAVVVAEFLGGSEEAFARKMTQKARALGMTSTVFRNASGLPNPAQVTTAKDMAILSRALYRDYPNQYKYFSLRSFNHKGIEHRNHNHLLGKVAGVDGIKTGFIGASGFNLAASAVRLDRYKRPRRLITVVMGGANRHWRDRRVTELLEAYFAREGARHEVPQTLDDAELNELIYEQEAAEEIAEETPVTFPKDIDSLLHDVSMEEEDSQAKSPEMPVKKSAQGSSTADIRSLPANWVVPNPGKEASKEDTVRTIQLSTVASEKKARLLATQAAKKLGFGRASVQKIQRGKRTLYSPQVNGVPATKAKNACQMLIGKCVILA
ncbi:D-alanyl-D-alanine carboxypeptidase family protein [Candidatus Odyssella thessalonicensis]|uniref:D-alanyl-D-alanine carboxypeptidase family protein n=1 Tax=Candidatus Odyssella thessalonicensis TaxID=84647 RepID=UPI000225A94A|nr:D-alanyl-D-alanine carboxypeptidase family protein [Candidatus Odyssella thessalonicensis]